MSRDPADNTGSAPGDLDRYLDGLMCPEESAAFERRLTDDNAVQSEVALQRRIDAALRARFTPPASIPLPSGGTPPTGGAISIDAARADRRRRTGAPPGSRLWAGVAAAACVLLAAGVGGYWWFVIGQPAPMRQPGDIWAGQVAASFTPEWVCTTDEEFSTNVRERFGVGAVLPLGTPGVQIVGWAYGTPVLSNKTATLITRVEGREVLVLIDRASNDVNLRRVGFSPGITQVPGLRLFKRRLGDLVLYEISPLESARVIPAFVGGA